MPVSRKQAGVISLVVILADGMAKESIQFRPEVFEAAFSFMRFIKSKKMHPVRSGQNELSSNDYSIIISLGSFGLRFWRSPPEGC